MEKFLFLDLDDTVFNSRRKCPDDETLRPAAFLKSGEPISYCNSKQLALLERFAAGWQVIPTTARNKDAFSRVKLPLTFEHGAILNHGALIINPDGQPDERWQQQMNDRLRTARTLLPLIEQQINDYAETHQEPLRVRIIAEEQDHYYVVVKHRDADSSALNQLRSQCVEPLLATIPCPFYIHANDNNLAILPAPINKSDAVAYRIEQLEEQYGPIMTMGMGDSLSDAGFLTRCDYALMPSNTQLGAYLTGASD